MEQDAEGTLLVVVVLLLTPLPCCKCTDGRAAWQLATTLSASKAVAANTNKPLRTGTGTFLTLI